MKKILLFTAITAVILMALLRGDARSDQPPRAFLLNMYHFNIQYVVGSEASMRRIIKQSFEPLVDFYLAHPGWGADFEMQGAMIEYMGESHPQVLEKFKQLVNSGQAELVTFHYGDQLLLAFPRHDQEWSLKINDKLLQKYGVKRSGVIFTQEAQFGEGFGPVGTEHGYDVAVMTTGTYNWFQDDDRFPYFTVNGIDVLTNKEATEPGTGIKVKWHFVGDGELVATAGISPYFPGLFRKNAAKLKLLEKQFQAAEKDGYKIAKVSEYVSALREAGVKPGALKPMLDSPWRPEDGSGVFQWMGKYATKWETDYDTRTKNWLTRDLLVEAERAGAQEPVLEEGWRHMINAEVSDPTGWYPFPVEVKFDYDEMEAVRETLQNSAGLDLKAMEAKAAARPETGEVVDTAPVAIRKFGTAQGAAVSWHKLASVPGAYVVEASWSGKGSGGLAFPWTAEMVEYSPALMEDTVRRIAVKDLKGKNIHVALTNGLIGLGNDAYLVRDNAAGYVAAGLYFDRREIIFEVQNGKEDHYAFRFYLLTSSSPDAALKLADQVNDVAP
ncbi:MAG TPA: hypothetical protein VM658_00355 [bacterium]|nr:hypothetical protein [bacterium]